MLPGFLILAGELESIMSTSNTSNWQTSTTLIHSGYNPSPHGETSEPVYLTQGFIYESAEAAESRFKGDEPGYIYSRYANPTVNSFEERMCRLEGAEAARATSTGMAAVNAAIMASIEAGVHVVAAKALFGSCRYIIDTILPRLGIETTMVDGVDLDQWQQAIRPNTSVVFLETPTNPRLEVIDISAVAELAHTVGARVVVDNVFATPIWQSPLQLGADTVVYSATKHIEGQGRCLGGIVLSDKEWIEEKLHPYFKHTGPSMSPFNAWVMLKGLETLELRVRRQTETAGKLAEVIGSSKHVRNAIYPGNENHPQHDIISRQMKGGSNLIAIELEGGKESAFAFCNALSIIKISNNLGDAKSLITHPATTTHQSLSQEARDELNIGDGLLRLSVGLEDPDDLAKDIESALSTLQ